MSNSVEIYICKKGQALKEGKIEYSQTIYDKYGAEDDAKARLQRNPSIYKVAYYKINDEGDFRIFLFLHQQEPARATERERRTKEKTEKKKAAKAIFLAKTARNRFED